MINLRNGQKLFKVNDERPVEIKQNTKYDFGKRACKENRKRQEIKWSEDVVKEVKDSSI